MKRSELVNSGIYAYRQRAAEQPQPIRVLDNKLWTMGETWKRNKVFGDGSAKVYEFAPARPGARAQGRSYAHNEVGIPVVMLRNSGWHFTRTGDERIVTPAADLLTQAEEKLGVDMATHIFDLDKKPKTYCKIVAVRANGKEVEMEAILSTVLPQQIVGDWSEVLKEAVARAEQEAKWAQEKKERQQAEASRSADIADRLDALLGKPQGTSRRYSGERYDCYRDSLGGVSSTFRVDEKVLLALLELAEKGAEK